MYNGPGTAPLSDERKYSRYRYFIYGMALYAREEHLKVHGVSGPEESAPRKPKGTEIIMPGGVFGTKTRPGQ